MRKVIATSMLILCVLFTFAQATLNVSAEQNEHFWVYVNGALQNEFASQSVTSNLAPGECSITVTMDNSERSTLTSNVTLQQGRNNYIVSYQPQTQSIFFRSAAEDAKAAGAMIGAFGQMVHQMNEMYEADTRRPVGDNPPPHGHPQPGMPPHGTPATPPPPGPGAYAPAPCPPAEFMEIKQMVRSADFENDKMNIAKQATSAHYFYVDQIADIARLFDFEHNKLEYVKFAYDYCIDRNLYYKLNGIFEFSSSKDELNDFIRSRN